MQQLSVVLRAWFALLALALACASPAQPLTPEEFGALEPEEALQVPVLDALEVFGWRRQEFLFVLENALIDLRYLYRAPDGNPSKALAAAVRTFQKEAGYTATGNLLVGEFMELIRRGNQIWQAPVFPGPVRFIETAGVVSLEGTWSSSDAAERDPVQITSLRCFQAAGLCSAVTAKLSLPEGEDGGFHPSAIDLALHTRDWNITHWSAEKIEAEDRSRLCATGLLVVDLKRQRAGMRSEARDDERCRGASLAAGAYELEDGYAIAARFWEERQSRAHRLRAQAFQQLVERVSKRR